MPTCESTFPASKTSAVGVCNTYTGLSVVEPGEVAAPSLALRRTHHSYLLTPPTNCTQNAIDSSLCPHPNQDWFPLASKPLQPLPQPTSPSNPC